MPRRASIALAGLIFATAFGFWQWRIVAPVHPPQPINFWNSDLYTIYVPVLDFAYRSGTFLPSWNPHQLAGVPFLANYNAGVLYPPNFLAAVVPAPRALDLLSMAHVALAGVLTLLAARASGARSAKTSSYTG